MSNPLPQPFQFVTPRLILRPFEDRDRAPFIAMNLDPEVMQFFAAPFTPERSEESIARYHRQLLRDGFTFLTAEHAQTGAYVGIVGMQVMSTIVPNLPQPAVEIGWRLTRAAHGHGYATEAARAFVGHAFNTLHLPELVAITATSNQPSRHVMEKLGMTHRPELTFNHPMVPADHPHNQHVLYSLQNPNAEEAPCA
ncbi:GNAT family N-acetyltransferase [Granulicella tundricola]|uniref:GCN5-related N-acetyltransferase n=1 Tax=Granulicella tundricola (strain ATCC BAA-1859 / DSM 23138 / MP5ACTX9) TaxID=1198114 RepID=E8WXU3_GRATM|nr:GNAT family N-acetyltransferase [Granulicella tundricola]ADW69788.1 GCN5-related N-acetyltransferase [Granulicella tundricola MP5ACTX9]